MSGDDVRGAIGPVEEPHRTAPDHDGPDLEPTVLAAPEGSALERRLAHWWQRLGPRRRTWSALVSAAVVLALVVPAFALRHHHPASPAPQPWPAQATDVRYSGIGTNGDPSGRRFTLLVTFINTSDLAVTVTQIRQPYQGMALTVTRPPLLPVTLAPHKSLVIQLSLDIRDCRRVPGSDDLPFLDVTLSNMRAIQQQSEILGDIYARDLSRLIASACR